MPVAHSPRQDRQALSLSSLRFSSKTKSLDYRSKEAAVGRESLIVDTAKRSYGLEQIVQAVDGAVVSLRGQLEALTILDETALTWPGLSLVLEDLEALVKLLGSRAAEAEHNVTSLQTQVTSLHAAASQSSKDQAASSKQMDNLNKGAAVAKRELTVVKAELASVKSEGSKHKEKCSDLQSQNASLSSEVKHTQQSLTAAQAKVKELGGVSAEQTSQIAALREELQGSLAELDQVEARLHDKDEVLVSLQQSVQAMQRQQAQDRQDLNVSNTQRGQLEGQEMHEQAAAQTAEVRKLYDWRDVMKTVHNERLQELAAKHHADRDSLLQTISQREAALEGCKAELAGAQQQLTSMSQQLTALQGSFTKQTAELHDAQARVAQLQDQVSTAQASHTRHLSEAAQLRQELRQLSSRLELAESDQQHLEATCKQATATAEAGWAVKVAEAEKEGAVLKALAQGWQREVAIVEPQLYQLQAQVAASQKQGNQEEHLLHMQQKLAELHQMQHDHQQQVRTVTAEAAAQQASANQLIKHLQDQLSTIQTANTESIQAVAKTPTEGTNWTIEQATASVARVLHVMATSRTE
ncbi:hypothetical protein ABBQ38_013942 [Trebouxia sp. C0009 RCD-2024]